MIQERTKLIKFVFDYEQNYFLVKLNCVISLKNNPFTIYEADIMILVRSNGNIFQMYYGAYVKYLERENRNHFI